MRAAETCSFDSRIEVLSWPTSRTSDLLDLLFLLLVLCFHVPP